MNQRSALLAAAMLITLLLLAACGVPLQAPIESSAGVNLPPSEKPIPRDAAPLDAPTPDLFVPTPEAALEESTLPPAALEAQQQLARRLEVDPQSVAVLSVEAVDWPDSCLGAADAGEMCAAVITPGYIIVMNVEGREYTLHTDESGSNFRIVDAPAAQTGQPVIRWMSAADVDPCVAAEIGLDGIAYGGCDDAELVGVPLTFNGRPNDLDMLRITYVPFSASTPAGDILFLGDGRNIATEAEQRMIAERAHAAYLEAQGGASAVGPGLVLQLFQQGGIAALCQNVSVYRTGIAYVADCTQEPPQTLPVVLLDSDQLAELYAWSDNLAPIESARTDGTADVMTTTLTFFGNGQAEPTAEMQQAMEFFALDVAAQARALLSADVCPAATVTLSLFRNDLWGYCLLYPDIVAPVAVSETSTLFAGNGDIMNDVDPRFEVEVIEGGGDVNAAADALEAEVLGAMADAQLVRTAVTLAGAEAVQMDNVPGQDLGRVLFVTNGDTLLKLTFVPADPATDGYEGMEYLYNSVLESFTFMP
jgi:hypothetical protein